MKLNLINKETKEVIAVTKEVSIFGRSSKCNITISDMTVSKKHCSITKEKDTVNIEDLGSKNHTYVPGKVLKEEGSSATLKHGDIMRVGKTELIIQINDQPLPKEDTDTPIKLAEEDPEIEVPEEDNFKISDEEIKNA